MRDKIIAFLKSKADIIERGLWTALQTLTAAGVVAWLDLDIGWAVPIAAALAFLKGALAENFGNGSAATLPASVEPMPLDGYTTMLEQHQEALAVLSEIDKFGTDE